MTERTSNFAWDSSEFRRLLAEQKPGQAFALIRKSKDLTQLEFGLLLHWDRTHAGRVERDEVGTIRDIYVMGKTADALGIPRLSLLPALLGTPDIGTIEVRDGEGVDDVDRREFGFTVLGAAAAASASGASASAATTGPIGSEHVAYVSDLTDRLWARDNEYGGGGLLNPALRQYAAARQLIDFGNFGERVGAELAGAVARLAECAGWLAFDSGDQHTARLCYLKALELAERSGDNGRITDVVDGMQWQAFHFGRNREALQLSLRATQLSRSIRSARLQAMLAARQGVAYAAVGDAREAEASISHAWREVDRGLDDPDDTVGLLFVTPSEIRSIEARARIYLGQYDKAVAIYRASLDGEGNRPRDEASYRAYFAASLAQLGDVGSAVTEGLSALSLLEGPVKSPRLVAELRSVRSVVDRAHGGDAEQFQTRFDALSKVA